MSCKSAGDRRWPGLPIEVPGRVHVSHVAPSRHEVEIGVEEPDLGFQLADI
jgi:hypothetical protein